MTNATVEIAPHCARTAEKVTANRRRIEDAMVELVKRKEEGLRNKPRAIARFLVSSLGGLTVSAKGTPNKAALKDIINVTLSVLD